MHPRDVVPQLRKPCPARQHGDIGNEADIAHELIALVPRVASEHSQLPLERREAEKRVEGGGLACAVRTDEAQDTALFYPHVNAVQRDGRAEGLAKALGFYACH